MDESLAYQESEEDEAPSPLEIIRGEDFSAIAQIEERRIDNFLQKKTDKDVELGAEDLRMATRHLGSIVGKVDVEEIIGSIFKDFCIGK